MNWGSVAVDERRQLMVVNNMHLPFVIHMIPREQDPATGGEGFTQGYGIGGQQRGTPFSARVNMFTSPLGLPCIEPPYGEMAVVDLTSSRDCLATTGRYRSHFITRRSHWCAIGNGYPVLCWLHRDGFWPYL